VDVAARKRHAGNKQRRQSARAIARHAGYHEQCWTPLTVRAVGEWAYQLVMATLPEAFIQVEDVNEDGIVIEIPTITEGALAVGEAAVEDCLRRNPVFLPCVSPPKPWTGWRDGGYWDARTRISTTLVRTPYKQSQAVIQNAIKSGDMAVHLEAVNALQAVAWTINQPVLDVINYCYDNGVVVKGLPPKDDLELPPRMNFEDWENADKRRLHKINIAVVRERNRALVGERLMFAEDRAAANALLADPAFYTPMSCDWRGRVYAVPHFNFQRDDRVRALFLFANGVPLGDEGLYWLKVHVANCGDFDKISKRSFDERVQWVDDNLASIGAITEEPTSSTSVSWWTNADKPFLFLAAAIELSSALKHGADFATQLPVSFDGSCSGLQHLCAMTRAPEGSLVNLTPSPLPRDVYQTVADLVSDRVSADAAASAPTAALAKLFLDYGITRKDVKRNVMTYSYSSKKFGMAQQHIDDLMRPLGLDVLGKKLAVHPFASPLDTVVNKQGEQRHMGDGYAAARYFASHVYDAIETVVLLPAKAMKFLQDLARILAHEGKPLAWTTPTGLPWVNRYHEPALQDVELWLHDKRVRLRVLDGHKPAIDKGRAANGVAPNFVHALDAAHLLLTAAAAAREGIVSATVHDSFGCHAPYARRYNEIIREQFVQMYQEHDVLAEALEAAKRDLTIHNWQRLPDVPTKGSLDLSEVLHAQFAFA
jgi:DNA-directed RNA polymerase